MGQKLNVQEYYDGASFQCYWHQVYQGTFFYSIVDSFLNAQKLTLVL